jgi:chitodextrinase
LASPDFTTRGYIEVWLGETLVSRHNNETEAVESLLAHADGNPSEIDRNYELRYPSKSVKVPGVRNPNSDNTPPTVPGNLQATAISSTSIQLTWLASTDAGTGVQGYQVWRNGTPLSPTIATTSFQDSGRTPGTTYTYNVTAFDFAGNTSALSNTAQATTQGTNNLPVWGAIADQQELTVGQNFSLALNATDADGQAITITQVQGTLPSGVTYNQATKTVSGTPTAAGSPIVTFRASDGIGNVDKAITFNTLNADSTAPNVPTGFAGVGFSRQRIDLSWNTATDPTVANARTSGLAGYRVYRNGLLRATLGLVTSYSDEGLSSGTAYSYTIAAFDAAGNASAQSSAINVSSLANRDPDWVTAVDVQVNSLPTQPTQIRLQAVDDDGDPIVYTHDALPSGWTLTELTNPLGALLTIPAATPASTYNVTVRADDGIGSGASNWGNRSTEAGVVIAHDFARQEELANHLNEADNRDLAEPIVLGVSPQNVCPHLLTEGGKTFLRILQIGGELVSPLATAPLTTHDYPTAVLTAATTTTGTLSLPLAAASLAIQNPLSLFKITNGANAGIFLNITSAPVTGSDISFNVATSPRTPLVAQTNISLQHVKVKDLNNPYQEMVIDEKVDEVGGQTWPSPTGWNSSADPVPADAYLCIINHDTTLNGGRALYRDKVTVVKKVYNPTTQLSTLTVRRAVAAHGDAGRMEGFVVNRYFPCEFPAGSIVGNDVTGGWTRPLAPLPAGDNGLLVADRAASGAVRQRQLFSGGTKVANFRSGDWGHADYHNLWEDGLSGRRAPFTPNNIASNGEYPFSGAKFYLSCNLRYSPMYIHRVISSKVWFLDQYQTPDMSQLVGSSPTGASNPVKLWWNWFHNYGSSANSDFPALTWEPPLGDWFAFKLEIEPGHDNVIEYNGTSSDYALTVIGTNDTVAQTLQITLPSIPASAEPGMQNPLDSNRYYASPQNPNRLDPSMAGFFGGAPGDPIYWVVTFKNGTWNNGQRYKVLNHEVSGGNTILTITKNRPLDDWPTDVPLVGDRIKLGWADMVTSARYRDTHIKLYKFEEGDTDWVLLWEDDWAITFNGGAAASAAGNPPGWNNFQPTGYANIDDGNPPGTRTIYTDYDEFILSINDIDPPDLT